MKKILFSPVGTSDPIKYDYDGSMLHICRHYKPEIIYLYLSKEIYKIHAKDNRYVSCIEQLGKDLNIQFDIRLIIRNELTEVQEYDYFYDDFYKEIEKIKKDMAQDDVLIFNMASGTPAMKSALLIISTIAQYKYIPIQVSTPQKSQNSKQDDRTEFDLDYYWELNNDNAPDAVNRCKENKCINLIFILKKDLIKQYISTYNYSAAMQIAYEIKESLSDDVLDLIHIANERLKHNFSEIDRILAKYHQYDIFPIKSAKEKKLFEYVLALNIKVKKEEYADFLRAITPLSTDICDHILENQCKINLKHSTTLNKNNVRCWDPQKIEPQIQKILCQKFPNFSNNISQNQQGNNLAVYSIHLESLILELSKDNTLKKFIRSMQEVEQKLRNIAAHEIISITDNWFKQNIGKDPNDVLSLIKNLVKVSIKVKDEYWNSFDKMNDMIFDLIK